MVHEVLTINVGEAGINLGSTVWQQYALEHGMDSQGFHNGDAKWGTSCRVFYEETMANQYVPRNLMIDTQSNTIDQVKTSKYSKIVHPEFLISANEDNPANNYARGYYTVGKEIIDKVNDRLRKLVDNCDNEQGFIINHSVGGGTGSGLVALTLR